MRRTHLTATLAILLSLPACGLLGPDWRMVREDGFVEGTGAISLQRYEGGFYAIRGDDGYLYQAAEESDTSAWNAYRGLIEEHPGGVRVEFRGALASEFNRGPNVWGVPMTYLDLEYIRRR